MQSAMPVIESSRISIRHEEGLFICRNLLLALPLRALVSTQKPLELRVQVKLASLECFITQTKNSHNKLFYPGVNFLLM